MTRRDFDRCVGLGNLAARRLAQVGMLSLGTIALQACGVQPGGTPVPMIQAQEAADRTVETSQLDSPSRVDFEWTLNEQDLRVAGRGVARLEPDKARLDLFLHNGASAVTVAVVDEEVRVPPGQMFSIFPAPPLMWAALGVFRPDESMTLLGGEALGEDVIRLRYQLENGGELWYQIDGGRVERVEMLEGGHVVHQVTLAREDGVDHPREATYRHMSAFREFKVKIDSVQSVDAYPADIWDPRR